MMRAFALLLFLLVSATDSLAQETDTPPAADMANVFVLGDSLAGGLGAGMKRLTVDDQRYSVQLRYQEESGLARADLYDWPEAVTKIAESNKIDIAIVMIGTNDARPIRSGGFEYAFATPEWNKAYVAEIDRLIASLKQTGAGLHWVSLPPMANPQYDSAIAAIRELQKQRVEAAGIHYIDLRKDLTNADGTYMERGPDDTGAFRKLRDRDGVHFMKVGNNKIGALVLAAIQGQGKAGDQPPAETAIPPEAKSEDSAVPGSGPIFGQAASEGVINVMRAESAGAADAVRPAIVSGPSYAAGSAAQRLFEKGVPPTAQPGRFDDFSYSQ
jgi:hypothetical protein